MTSASRTIDIEVAHTALMDVICDFEAYPTFIEEMSAVEILESKPGQWTVGFDVVLFRRRIEYTLDLFRESDTRLKWKLVTGGWMLQNDGQWSLVPLDDETTRATYSVTVRLRGTVPDAVSHLIVDASVPKLLDEFKRRAESLAGRTDEVT